MQGAQQDNEMKRPLIRFYRMGGFFIMNRISGLGGGQTVISQV